MLAIEDSLWDDDMDDERQARDTIAIYSKYIARNTVGNKISFSALFTEENLRAFHKDVQAKKILRIEKTVDYRTVTVPVLYGFSSIDDSINDYSELYKNSYLNNKRWPIELPYSEMCFLIIRLEHVYYEMDMLNSAWRDSSQLERAKALFINNWKTCKYCHPTEDECDALLRSLNGAQVRTGLLKALGKVAAAIVAFYLVIHMGSSFISDMRERATQRREATSAHGFSVNRQDVDDDFYEPDYDDAEPQDYSYTGIGEAYEETPREQNSLPADAVEWSEAASHVGESVAIYGRVVDTEFAPDSTGQPTFLDIGRGYPDPSRLSVVIWGEDRSNFDDYPERAYRGSEICVYGEVYAYEDHYCIQVTSPSQIVVLD